MLLVHQYGDGRSMVVINHLCFRQLLRQGQLWHILVWSMNNINHRTITWKRVTNYYHTTIVRKILHNMITINMMSFALCLHQIGIVIFTQNHSLSFPFHFMYKID